MIKILEKLFLNDYLLPPTITVLFKLFLDKWDGSTQVVPGLPGSEGGTPPVIVGGRR